MGEVAARWLLALLVIVYVGLGVTYALATPCFESPDEWSHLSVVRYWAEHRAMPPRVLSPRNELIERDETWYFGYHDPPLYYAPPLYHCLAALLTSFSGAAMDDLPYLLIPSPSWEKGWAPRPDSDPWNKNIFAHRPEETLAQSDTVRAAALLRVISLGLGAVTVLCAYALAHLLWPDRPALALGAAAFVAFNPQFVALSIGVTNDNLLNALFGLSLVCMLRFARDGAGWLRWALLGGLVGLGLLTKQSALLLLPLGMLAATWRPKKTPLCSLFIVNCSFLIAALAVGGWWYVRNAILYDDPLGLESHFVSQTSLAHFGLRETGMTLRSYWAAFGWAPLLAEPPVYAVAALAALAALAGIVMAIRPGGSLWRAPAATRRGLALLVLALVLNVASFVRWAVDTGSPVGRLLFPTIPVVGVLVAWGLSRWNRWRVTRWGLGVVVALAFTFAAIVPWRYLRPAYASPYLPGGMPDAAQSVGLVFQNGIQLAGYDVSAEDMEPGEEFRLTLYWRAQTATERLYRVWVQLGPQDATRYVASSDVWLGGTLYPSELWRAGDTVRQEFRLTVPDWAPAPGLYWARIGLVDDIDRRVKLEDGSSESPRFPLHWSDMVVLGPWRMRAAAPPSPPAYTANFRLDHDIRLLGYDLEQQGPAVWRLALYWQAERVPEVDYTVFVHLIDAQGNLVGQHDGPPRDGAYPISWWLPGEIVVDQHTVSLSEPRSGPARLLVGMYDPATLIRLPARDGAGQRLPDDSVPLVEVTFGE